MMNYQRGSDFIVFWKVGWARDLIRSARDLHIFRFVHYVQCSKLNFFRFISGNSHAWNNCLKIKIHFLLYKKIVPRRTREEYPDWSKLSVCWLLEEGWSILFLKNLLFLFKKAATIFLEFNRKLGRISWRILAARSDVDRIGGDGNHVVFICYSSAPRAWDFKSCDVRCSFWWFNDDVRLRIAH